jgi:hypothetical protein
MLEEEAVVEAGFHAGSGRRLGGPKWVVVATTDRGRRYPDHFAALQQFML